jgi:hypothetical protein
MVLLQPIIEIPAGAVHHLAAQYPANGTRVGVVRIGSHAHWLAASYVLSCCKKLLGGVHVSLLREHGVHRVAIAVYGTIKAR